MAWDDALRSASWRGIPFVATTDPTRAGRHIAQHEYPFRDKQPVWPEDTGRAPREFVVTGYLYGDDVVQQRQTMTDAVDQQFGPGELIHPQYGTLSVVLMKFACSARSDLGRMVEMTFDFVEAGAQVYPEGSDDTGAQVDGAADQAKVAATDDYTNRSAPSAEQTTTGGRIQDAGIVPASNVA